MCPFPFRNQLKNVFLPTTIDDYHLSVIDENEKLEEEGKKGVREVRPNQ
jgi:hypothetical protein